MTNRIVSGIQPSGALHLGNYIGALSQWLELQQTNDCFFCIVDYHAITVRQDPQTLSDNTYALAAMYLALGINPARVTLFKQSDVSAHTELAWILSTFTHMGELERMTQYKDKVKQQKKNNSVGLFTYPVLMAADILLYQPSFVPVGEDQKQHLELTRDLAERFNQIYGHTFTVPEYFAAKQGARIMSLDDPTKKMSKSATTEWGYIALTDEPDVIMKKMKRAVTDSGSDIKATPEKPALSNLLTIFSVVTGKPINRIEDLYQNQGYGKFKTALAEALITWLEPIQQRYHGLVNNREELDAILQTGAAKAQIVATKTLSDVKNKLGLS